jgi:DNA mismatch endonuclease (patch repair protein)
LKRASPEGCAADIMRLHSDAVRTNGTPVPIMSDTLSPALRSERMGRIRGRDSKPELIVRRLLHAMGYRYRLHAKELPGRPDIVFRGRHAAIFVQGCFWHRHPDPACRLARLPKSRLDFWLPKLEGNRERDVANIERLEAAGWRVLLVWECQLKDREQLGNKLRRFVEGEE